MKTERGDHRNRLLREGESQCKDGRYRYTYYENGKQKAIYSWKLEAKDKLPVGKRIVSRCEYRLKICKRNSYCTEDIPKAVIRSWI